MANKVENGFDTMADKTPKTPRKEKDIYTKKSKQNTWSSLADSPTKIGKPSQYGLTT